MDVVASVFLCLCVQMDGVCMVGLPMWVRVQTVYHRKTDRGSVQAIPSCENVGLPKHFTHKKSTVSMMHEQIFKYCSFHFPG